MTFFLVASLILFVMQVIIGLWFYFLFPAVGWKMPVVLLPILLTLFVRFVMMYTRTHYGTLESLAYYTAYIWVGLLFIFFSLVIILAVLYAAGVLCHLSLQTPFRIITLVIFATATVLSLWGGLSQPKIKTVSVKIPNTPRLTAAVISDTHLGTGVSLARWKKVLTRIEQQKPDIIFVLGDLFEYGMNAKAYAEALSAVKTPLGTYGVLGNHEYYMGYENSIRFYQQAGIKLLKNEFVILPNGLQIIGINDVKTASVTEEHLDKLLAKTNPDRPRILLSHQPLLIQTAADHKIDLMLSGHTHAGQIWPFNYLVKWKYPYWYGLYQTGPQSRLYVTSGVFYWGIPLRLFAPAEIPIIKLHD